MSDKSLEAQLRELARHHHGHSLALYDALVALADQVGELEEAVVDTAGLRVLDALRIEALEGALREIEEMDDAGWCLGAARHVARVARNPGDTDAPPATQGIGTDDDPGREVRSYYTKAGELIGNDDPYNAPTLDQIEKPTTKRAPKARGKKGKR